MVGPGMAVVTVAAAVSFAGGTGASAIFSFAVQPAVEKAAKLKTKVTRLVQRFVFIRLFNQAGGFPSAPSLFEKEILVAYAATMAG
jgi:hypothetical protein